MKLLDYNPFVAIMDFVANKPVLFYNGANTGQTIGKMFLHYPNSKIHSFEPAVNCIKELSLKHGFKSNVFIIHGLVGEKSDEIIFNQFEWNSLNSILE